MQPRPRPFPPLPSKKTSLKFCPHCSSIYSLLSFCPGACDCSVIISGSCDASFLSSQRASAPVWSVPGPLLMDHSPCPGILLEHPTQQPLHLSPVLDHQSILVYMSSFLSLKIPPVSYITLLILGLITQDFFLGFFFSFFA